jgi:hypothetical protein
MRQTLSGIYFISVDDDESRASPPRRAVSLFALASIKFDNHFLQPQIPNVFFRNM